LLRSAGEWHRQCHRSESRTPRQVSARLALAVHAPKRLLELRPGNVVLMNPVYLAEVTAQVRSLGLDTHVHSVNDLLAPQPDR
jgi:hypothetical protein